MRFAPYLVQCNMSMPNTGCWCVLVISSHQHENLHKEKIFHSLMIEISSAYSLST